ncbi:MAG: polysaccharide deacetylase [Actinomycetia bacterium]|nr:polysaccharide deacetylase [Actinomycetes bacterium]
MRRAGKETPFAGSALLRAKRRELGHRKQKRRRAALLLAALNVAVACGAFLGVPLRAPRGADAKRAQVWRSSPRPSPRTTHGAPLKRSRATPARRRSFIFSVPILMYHVINRAPPNVRFPGLYVLPAAFAAQMSALAAAGYRGVTLDQLVRPVARRAPFPSHPIVITFDNGYRSQYMNAFPILRRLGWPAVENLQLSGLPPSQGGLDTRQVRRLVQAGWELDTQGFSHADLPTLNLAQLRHEVRDARMVIRRRYHVPVHWFCYPSGRYDDAVVTVVKSSGYIGATTVVPGWANQRIDLYRLPRLRVLAGTSPSALLGLIAGTREDRPPPNSF